MSDIAAGAATTPLPASVVARTVPQMLQAAVDEAPQRPATIGGSLLESQEVTLTYVELAERAARLAAVLRDRGVGRGDRLAILIGNDGIAEAHVAYHAAHHLGAINVPINTFYVGRELAHALGAIQPAAILFGSKFAPLVDEAREAGEAAALIEVARTPLLGESLGDLLEASTERAAAIEVTESEDADWLFTSGTMGSPKAVALTHANSVACGHEARNIWGLDGESVYQNSSPFFTSTGCHTNMQACLAAGCTFVVDPEVDAAAIVDRANRHGTTSMFALTAILAILFRRLDDGRLSSLEFERLRRLVYGGQTMPRTFHERVEQHFARERDIELALCYGLTEGGTSGVWLEPQDHAEAVQRHGPYGMSIGRAGWNEWVEHRIVADGDSDAAPGEVGEILLRAPSVMSRYVDNEQATAEALGGGWLHTGDMATVDEDGFIYVVDRSKAMIRRGGMNIAAAEVEGVALGHPAVSEAAVLGRPNPVLGEDVHLVAVLKPGADADGDDLIAFCREHLADYKVPRSVSFMDALPRNAMNKVARQELTIDT
jgi:acyl-CoA synthetase (AMP-forming)/AMP-acid ligase II